MNKRAYLIALALLVLAGVACSFCPFIPSGPSGPLGGKATITLVNNSDTPVCFVYISPTTSDEWGDDWLGTTEIIDPGGQRIFEVDPGTYDMMATDCDDNEIDTRWEVEVTTSYTWVID
ncbi:MAG TPA: hypothetical protein G4O00_02730 [Thermoflexia bacterium]|jgi:hypothetical protein|nr:hypothetical protein [Thermoflexia bacterium]